MIAMGKDDLTETTNGQDSNTPLATVIIIYKPLFSFEKLRPSRKKESGARCSIIGAFLSCLVHVMEMWSLWYEWRRVDWICSGNIHVLEYFVQYRQFLL